MTREVNFTALRRPAPRARRFGRHALLAYLAYNVVAIIVLFPVIRAGFDHIDFRALAEVWSGVAGGLGLIAREAGRLAGELLWLLAETLKAD